MSVQNNEHPLVTLFQAYSELDNPPVLELLSIDRKPVGAIYLNKFKYKNFIISETNNSEKYYYIIQYLASYFLVKREINPKPVNI